MTGRSKIRQEALLFNSNSMYDLLRTLGRINGDFHAAALSRMIQHSRAQTKVELDKLRALGIIESGGSAGRIQVLRLADDILVDAVLELPDLLMARLTAITGTRSSSAE